MELGIYRITTTDDTTQYTRLALYDFDADEWAPTSNGWCVSQISATPSPEELVARFGRNSHTTMVAPPDVMETRAAETGADLTVADGELTVDEGHQRRDERGGPPRTQLEREHLRQEGITVVPDDFDLPDDLDTDTELIRESDYDGFDFTDHISVEFPDVNPDHDTTAATETSDASDTNTNTNTNTSTE